MSRLLRLLRLPLLLVCILLGSAHLTGADEFSVGGRSGWVVKPDESYDRWAESLKFKVNDTLVFNYVEGEDSVLVVSKSDFDTCNTSNPDNELDDGNSVFLLDRSGSFFFISGEPGHCAQGQKLTLVVMASPPPFPAPGVPPPSVSPPPPASAPPPAPSSAGAIAVSTSTCGVLTVLLCFALLG